MNRRISIVGSLSIVSVILLGAVAPPVGATEREISDPAITDAIEDEFLFDQAVPFNDLDVRTSEGIVTLTGEVDNILAKERATHLAETVKGVRAVVNQVMVKPPEQRADDQIQDDVKAALLRDPATESFEINVHVQDGEVTLGGTVGSWQERELAATVAKGVRGVTALKNYIKVDYETDRPDSEIKREIEQTLLWDALVDHALIDVEVQDGKVRLDGVVGSVAEKRQAISDAYVAGVASVSDADLKVQRWARDEDLRKGKYVARSDQEIREAVKDAMLYDPRVYSFNVTPKVSNGIVSLHGIVENLKAKRVAEQNARNTVGAIGVKNRLKVRPPGTVSDRELAQRVRDALQRDPFVEPYEVTVSVVDGTAYLNGTVDTYFEKGQADDVVSRVAGVVEVRNNIDVDYPGAPIVYDPYAYDWYPYGHYWYDYTPSYSFRTDWEIKQEIKDELWWSPYVDSDEVNVTVEDGEATLTGTVDSWLEYRSATENALEGGAIRVWNRLEVQ
jgi:osmotically-inducible protein OsmY